jgi:hypothetical protein
LKGNRYAQIGAKTKRFGDLPYDAARHKQRIFHEEADYQSFLDALRDYRDL